MELERLPLRIADRIENEIEVDNYGVWVVPGRHAFAYSDGRTSERYLEAVLSRATDLSADSYELEKWIRDWPSEYHLSRKRAHLLREFAFSRDQSAFEVGCGCGAITRFLGETFHDVVAVEGSLARARLARTLPRRCPDPACAGAPIWPVPDCPQPLLRDGMSRLGIA